MKKFLIVFSILLVFGVSAACDQKTNDASIENISEAETNLLRDTDDNNQGDYPFDVKQSFILHSKEEYKKMLEMTDCKEEEFKQYTDSIGMIGIDNAYELAKLVKVLDSLPKIDILEGDIYLIQYSHKVDLNSYEETICISIGTRGENGDWVRIEYYPSVKTDELEDVISFQKSIATNNCILGTPIKSKDGRLNVYIETRNPHPSYDGTAIIWIGDVDGIFVKIHSCWADEQKVVTSEMFGSLTLNESMIK